MGTIKVEAGDFKTGKHSSFSFGTFSMAIDEMGWTGYKTKTYHSTAVAGVEVASEESVKRFGGTVGWGVAGGVILGPVGLLAGLLAGGNRKQVTFVCAFNDGKKFLGTTDSKTFTKISAAQFGTAPYNAGEIIDSNDGLADLDADLSIDLDDPYFGEEATVVDPNMFSSVPRFEGIKKGPPSLLRKGLAIPSLATRLDEQYLGDKIGSSPKKGSYPFTAINADLGRLHDTTKQDGPPPPEEWMALYLPDAATVKRYSKLSFVATQAYENAQRKECRDRLFQELEDEITPLSAGQLELLNQLINQDGPANAEFVDYLEDADDGILDEEVVEIAEEPILSAAERVKLERLEKKIGNGATEAEEAEYLRLLGRS